MDEFHATEESSDDSENYFVSMTDMMVGMLFLFIIMLMMFALNYRRGGDDSIRIKDCLLQVVKENAAISEDINAKIASVQERVRAPIEALELAADQRLRLLTDIKTQLEAQGIQQVEIEEKNGVLRLSERAIRFDPSKADLDAAARENVSRVAKVLLPVVRQYAACRADALDLCRSHTGAGLETLFIEGHTDSTGVANLAERDRKNWQLSSDRATTTYRALLTDAPELKDLRNRRGEQIVSVSAYSSTRPIASGDEKAAWARNRRIDIRFVMDAETKFGLDDIRLIRSLNAEIRQQMQRIAQISQEGVARCK